MDYSAVRDSIQSGDVVAFTHTGFGSLRDIQAQIVRIATRSEYSHVGIVWKIVNRLFLLEAVVPEVRIFPLSNFEEFYLIPLNKKLSEKAENYALSRVGQKYSKLEAIKGYFGWNKRDSYWQCAEFVSSVLKENEITITGKDTPTNIVRELLEKYSGKLELITNRR